MGITRLEQEICGIEPWTQEPYDSLGINVLDLGLKFNSIPYESDMAIIVTSWRGHLKFLRRTLTNYRLSGKFVICAYDPRTYDPPFNSYVAPTGGIGKYFEYMPYPAIFAIPHVWVFKHMTFDCDKRNGWFWDLKYAHGIIKQFPNFKYVFSVNGDCIWEDYDNVGGIVDLLGDGDLIASSSDGRTIHTCSVLYTRDAFDKIMDNMSERMRIPVVGSQSPEGMLYDAVQAEGLKEIVVEKQPHYIDGTIDHYHSYDPECTWKDILGFKNLGGIHDTACTERLEPVDGKYVDSFGDYQFMSQHERKTLCNFYKTGDRRWLYMYWDQGEDSWWDRVTHPLEFYGKEPILNVKVPPIIVNCPTSAKKPIVNNEKTDLKPEQPMIIHEPVVEVISTPEQVNDDKDKEIITWD